MSIATSWGDSLSSLKRMGEVWKMATPVEGTLWWIDEYVMTDALADKPFLKKVAEEWINMSLSTHFQINHLIREINIYPVVTNIADKLTTEEKERILLDTSESFLEMRILQTTYSQRDRDGLKILWDEALKGRQARKEDN
jgi:spermidine/putrescine transport system substrate-binding protein